MPYNGLFMRHDLGETPDAPDTGWSGSPDVWPYGPAIEPDRAKFTTPAGYATDWGTVVKTGGLHEKEVTPHRGFSKSRLPRVRWVG